MLFGRKKRDAQRIVYDPALQEPAVRISICTGEMSVGFLDRSTGRFHEYEAARDQADVDSFCARAGIRPSELRKIY